MIMFPSGKEQRVDISVFNVLNDEDCDRLLNSIIPRFNLLNSSTAVSKLHSLKWIGDAFENNEIYKLPQTDDHWQRLVLLIHRYVFTRSDSKSSLTTRNERWLALKKVLEDLQSEGVIPISVFIPRYQEKLENLDISLYQSRVLGDHIPETEITTLDKLLIPIHLARTDAEYLDELYISLSEKRRVLHDVLVDYFYRLRDNYRFGQKLIKSVHWPSLRQQILTHLKTSKKVIQDHPANPTNSLANYLCVIKNELSNTPVGQKQIIQMDTMWVPYNLDFEIAFSNKTKNEFPANFNKTHRFGYLQTVNWMLGKLSHMDVAYLSALLIMLNPKFTPYSLLNSRLFDKNGKKYIETKENGAKLFSIEKSRAKAMKTETLDDISIEVLELIIEMSEPIREQLEIKNDPKASFLFLPIGRGMKEVAAVNYNKAAAFLSGTDINPDSLLWLGALYPKICDHGLSVGTISFSKIRNTEGVLEWFRTGSIKEASRKLGNTQKIVLEHYIPKALLAAWNTRLIRRFQNLWIAIAAADEEYLLDVTDFHSLGDLHAFLMTMLKDHSATSSPFASELHRKFSTLMTSHDGEGQNITSNAALSISISVNGLAALYLYSNAVQASGLSTNKLSTIDPITKLSPKHFLDLASVLKHSLPDHKDPHFQSIHFSAIELANSKNGTLAWQDFIFTSENNYA